MFYIKVADIRFRIDNTYNFIKKLCNEYIIPESADDIDVEIRVSGDDISYEANVACGDFSRQYLEASAAYRKICSQLPRLDAFMLHASVVSVDGCAYAFSAPSGTGKTTHTELWRNMLKNRFTYINGDKPVIRFKDGIPYAYGTPWQGSEWYGANICAPLRAICFLRRSENPEISRISAKEALFKLMPMVYISDNPEMLEKTYCLIDRFLKSVSLWDLKCDISEYAAGIAYEAMRGK